MTRWRRFRLILLGLAVVLLVLGPALWHHYLGPQKIRAYAIDALKDLTGGDVAVGSGSFSLFSGIVLKNVDISERGAAVGRPVVHVGTITVDAKLREMFRGNFVVRRVVVDGLAINVELDKDMNWPAAKMFAQTGGGGPPAALPSVTISDLSFRLACPDAPAVLPPVEISQVNLSFKRAYKSTGKYELAVWSRDCGIGGFNLAATYYPQEDAARGSLRWERVALGPRLARHLPAAARRVWDDMNVRNGQISLSCDFSWTPANPRPLDYTAHVILRDLAFRHVRVPYDFESVQTDVSVKNENIAVESLSGRMGPAVFSAKGVARLAGRAVEGEFSGDVKGIMLDDALRSALPPDARKTWDAMKPAGRLAVQFHGRMTPGRDLPAVTATVELEGFSCAPPELPFPLSDVAGKFSVDERSLKVGTLAGTFGSGVFRVPSGTISLAGDDAFDLSVEVEKLAYDGPCVALVPPAFAADVSKDLREFLDKARTAWKIELTAAASRRPGAKDVVVTATVNLTDGLFAHPAFGKPLTDMRAVAKYADGVLDLAGFVANWGPAKLEVKPLKASLVPPKPFTFRAIANGIVLDDELRALLPKDAQTEWDRYKPGGLCDADVTARIKPGAAPEVDVSAGLRDGTLRYADFPYPITQARGRVEVRNAVFRSAHVEGVHDDAALVVDVKDLSNAERSGLQVAVRASNVPIDKALYQALLPDFRPVWDALSPTGVITEYEMVFNRYTKATGPGWYDFAVEAKFNDLKVDCGMPVTVGRANVIISRGEGDDTGRLAFSGTASTPATQFERIPLANTSLAFYWRDNKMFVKDLVSDCYGGTLTGTAMLNLAVPRNEFTGKVALYNADISQVLADSGGESISGRVSATSKISAELVTGGAFNAVGGMVIRSGRIGELPGVLGVLNLLVLNRPDAPVFHTLEVAYELRGSELTIYEINLLGEILSLYGKGVITEDKKLMFRFTPEFGPQLPRIPWISDLLDMLKGNLIPLTIRGDYNDPVFMVNPLMPVTNIMQTIFGQIAPIGTKISEMLPKIGARD